jgi:protein involved in ribonucleotide reduction
MTNQLVYWSGTGVTKRIAEMLGGIPLDEYEEGDFIIMFPSYGAPHTGGHIPPAVDKFLDKHWLSMTGVVGVGNVTFGEDFCRGARDLSWLVGVPLIAEIDMVPSYQQIKTIEYAMKGS